MTSARPVIRPGLRRLAMAALVLLVPVASWSAWDYIEARRLARQVAAISARGEAVQSSPRVPYVDRPDNAARYYEAAAALLDRTPLWGATGIYATLNFERGDRATLMGRIRTWLEQNRESERLLDLGTGMEFTGFRPGSGDSLRTDRMSSLERMAALRAIERADAADGDGAARAMVRQMRVARAIEVESWAGDLLARALTDVRIVLEAQPGETPLHDLQRAILEHDRDDAVVRAAIESRAALIESMWDQGRAWYGRPSVRFGTNPLEPLTYLILRPWFARRVNADLPLMNAAVEQARQPWPERLQFDAGSREPRPTRRILTFPIDHPAGVLTYLHMRNVESIGRMLASVRTSAAAVAVERYRRTHGGRPPASLDQVVPAWLPTVPTDPFSGQPLEYSVQPDRYVVYSVGPNAIDDGGSTISPPKPVGAARPEPPKDIGVRVGLRTGVR
jgi:hypothetical protein